MSYSVLLSDDEPFILRGLRRLIPWEELGYHIVGEAQDGAVAARLLVELKPDIALSDICMPGLSGIELLKLVSISKLPIKVIFMSGHREFAYAKDALSFGAVDYLLKPLRVEELRRALSRAAERLEAESRIPAERGSAEPSEEARPEETEQAATEFRQGRPAAARGLELAPPGDWPLFTAFAFLERESPRAAGAESTANLRLMRYAVINLMKRFGGPERGIVAAEREGAILAVMGHGPREDLASFAELARGTALAELGATLEVSTGPTVSSSEAVRGSCEIALGGLLSAEASRPRGAEVGGIGRAIDHMESHFRESLALESVAEVACMNPYYFSALFKKRVGVNFKDYLSRLRAEEARRLLLTTDLSCAEIAAETGLGDSRRFGETFKKHFGATPAEYRSDMHRRMPK